MLRQCSGSPALSLTQFASTKETKDEKAKFVILFFDNISRESLLGSDRGPIL